MRDLTLRGLTEDELAAVIPDATHALWVASRGLPGVARSLAAELTDGGDPIVRLGGRARQTTAEAERARVNVTRTLRAALDRISACAPRAGAHLHASIRTGLACRYDLAPCGPARWHA